MRQRDSGPEKGVNRLDCRRFLHKRRGGGDVRVWHFDSKCKRFVCACGGRDLSKRAGWNGEFSVKKCERQEERMRRQCWLRGDDVRDAKWKERERERRKRKRSSTGRFSVRQHPEDCDCVACVAAAQDVEAHREFLEFGG